MIETPLRMPRADEIAILDTNYDLPDEELDINYTADARTPVSRSEVAAELENTMNRPDFRTTEEPHAVPIKYKIVQITA